MYKPKKYPYRLITGNLLFSYTYMTLFIFYFKSEFVPTLNTLTCVFS